MELCKSCNAGCCRAVNAEVLGCDILTIHKALGISPFFFIIVLPVTGEKLQQNLGKTPLFKFRDLQQDVYYKLLLKSQPSPLATTKCLFLMEWRSEEDGNLVVRCGIHGIRPYVCRTFPARLGENLTPVIDDPYIICNENKKTDSFWENPDYQMCPRQVKPEDYAQYSEQYYKDVYMQHYETQFFLQLSEKWNQNPDVSDNFIEFLENEYKNRLTPIEYPGISS